ncbi:GntR family transcriptional regulator [uncultured Eubacterium sp.]|uniref:GntR family transcriptional regulator n=1 Tax=uncultured Eubacterium sp. TaxID=165185 RepID=UPI00259A793B|nr:GntR family transcriptional regulator [uncultured Eubacterium sp.]
MGDNHSLSEKVFHKLQEDILSGKYAVDEELKEKTIGDELGVSRTPVREALRQLELQGLVTITPNKGAHVTGFSKEDLNDIYEIRSVMEGLCAKWAAKKATPEQIEELEEIVYLTEFHVSKGHSGQVFELDNKFHETLYQASGSKVLAGVLTDFHNYVQRVRKMTLKSKERSEKSNDEHRMIAQAIHDHDPEKAQMLANQHIMRTIENIDHCGWDNLLQESKKENENSGN